MSSFLGSVLYHAVHSSLGGMQILFLLLALLVVTRRRALALTLFLVGLPVFFALAHPKPLVAALILVTCLGLATWALIRQGVLAIMVAFFVQNFAADCVPFTTDFSVWYAWQTWAALALFAGFVGYGLWTATGGRLVQSGAFLEV